MIQVQSANKRRFTFSLLFTICFGLFLVQWQGFNHGVHHASGQHESIGWQGASIDLGDGGDYSHKHHCASYDALTLNFALTIHLAVLPVNDAKYQLAKAYLAYQALIAPQSSFEARAPPLQHA